MKKLSVLCFFVFLIPALGCVGSANIEHALLANLSEVTAQTDEEALGIIVFTLLEATIGAEISTVIQENGQGMVRYGFSYEPDVLLEAKDDLPAGFLDSLNCHSATRLLLDGAPAGADLTQETSGATISCMVQIEFENLLELADIYQIILRPLTQSSNQDSGPAVQAPLVDIRCLEMVDGSFYQDFVINPNAVKPDDVALLDVFGIDLQWRLSMVSNTRYHNALQQQAMPLSWNLLNPPERLSVNMMQEDACPSSRVKLLLEFTNTETTLATLTVPISRRAEDYLQNEAVRQRLTQHGWATQIEGSANHAPRIVALQQFEREKLALLMSTIPGLKASTNDAGVSTPQPVSDGSSISDAATLFSIDLDLDSFANTWALLMPTHAPTAFELVINSMQPIATVDGVRGDPTEPFLLWNGSVDDTQHNLAFALNGESDILLASTKDEEPQADLAVDSTANVRVANSPTTNDSAAETDIAEASVDEADLLNNITTETAAVEAAPSQATLPDATLPETARPEDSAEEDTVAAAQVEDVVSPTRAAGVLGPQSPLRVADLSTSKRISVVTVTPKPTATQKPTATPTSTTAPIAVGNQATLSASNRGNAPTIDGTETEDRVALRPNVPYRSGIEDVKARRSEGQEEAGQSIAAESEDATAQTLGDLIETEAAVSDTQQQVENSEEGLSTESTVQELGAKSSASEIRESALALKVADILEKSNAEPTQQSTSPIAKSAEKPRSAAVAIDPENAVAVESSLPACQVVIEWLNLRPGPGLEYGSPIAALPQGTELLIVGQGPWGTWVEVIAATTLGRGWVSLDPEFVACADDLTGVPVVDLSTLAPTGESSANDAPAPVDAPIDAPIDAPDSQGSPLSEGSSDNERESPTVKVLPAGK